MISSLFAQLECWMVRSDYLENSNWENPSQVHAFP